MLANLAFVPIFLSFMGFAVTLMLPGLKAKKGASLATAAAYLGFTAWVVWNPAVVLPAALQAGGWPAPFGITLVYDGMTALMTLVTGCIYLAVILYGVMGDNMEDSPLVFPMLHILVCGISGAFTTGDLFNLYVWFEVILLSSFVLLSLEQGKIRLAGTFKYVVLNIVSSLMFLMAAGLVYNAAHSLNFSQLSLHLEAMRGTHPAFVDGVNGLLLAAFAIKAGLFPFFFWLPASYHHLSPAVSGLFAGLLTKVGLYAILRVNILTFPESPSIQGILTLLACASIIIGVAGAIYQLHIRRILGFHIISQVGYIALAVVFATFSSQEVQILGIAAALFYMVHHILVKANLFLVSGLIRTVTGSEHLSQVRGLLSYQLFLGFLFALPALSLAGIPPFSGFWAKLGLLQVSITAEQFFFIGVMLLGGFFTVFSMAKIWLAAFWGEPDAGSDLGLRAPKAALAACLLLTALSLSIGLNPDLLYEGAHRAAQSLVTGVQHASH